MRPGYAGEFADDRERNLCRKAAGPYIDALLASPEAAKEHLTRADPRARLGAIFTLRYYWKAEDASDVCRGLATCDPDSEVRAGALCFLGHYYYGSRDAEMGHLFATIARDETQDPSCRTTAYFGLFSLVGWRGDLPDSLTFQIPDSLDNAFLAEFAPVESLGSESEGLAEKSS